ncbi:DUF2079 domain-containing protein [Catenuloplanes japonicus]|uniref:DUF2079 domain-containing protein n=1 Tax=Catenuloplanes japonicus TaxID=33876 RepID=UPI0007C474D6|nr:DUF2079 domain-containing protein [Catenuloplanes japonicus]
MTSTATETETPSRGRPLPFRVPVGAYLGWGFALALFALYTAASVRGHQLLTTYGYDLGIFEQVVRSYSEGHMGVTELKGPGFRQLGDHFAPALILLAPFYWLFPSPLTLLVAQSALMAVAVVPLVGWAHRALGTGAAVVIGVAYGLSFGIAQAIRFDFHEIAFAVPLLAFSMTALGEKRPVAAAAWALPLLLVKEDLGLTVAAIGLLIAFYGARRLGLAVAAAGVVGMALVVLVFLPAMNPDGAYAYTSMVGGGDAERVVVPAGRWVREVLFAQTKVTTLFITFGITAFAALRSPLALVVLPTFAWRFAADKPAFWGVAHHYSAVLMPILFAALIAALVRTRSVDAPESRRIVRVELAAVTAAALLMFPVTPLYLTFRADTWREPERVRVANSILNEIPDDVHVAASNNLAPQLTDRTLVTLFGFEGLRPNPQWIVVDLERPLSYPIGIEETKQALEVAKTQGYVVVRDEMGITLLKRP